MGRKNKIKRSKPARQGMAQPKDDPEPPAKCKYESYEEWAKDYAKTAEPLVEQWEKDIETIQNTQFCCVCNRQQEHRLKGPHTAGDLQIMIRMELLKVWKPTLLKVQEWLVKCGTPSNDAAEETANETGGKDGKIADDGNGGGGDDAIEEIEDEKCADGGGEDDAVKEIKDEQCDCCGCRDTKLKTCPCLQALYCNEKCQLEHWKVHKKYCAARKFKKKGEKLTVIVEEETCAFCGRLDCESKLKICRCRRVDALYCSEKCYLSHWNVHKKVCWGEIEEIN